MSLPSPLNLEFLFLVVSLVGLSILIVLGFKILAEHILKVKPKEDEN